MSEQSTAVVDQSATATSQLSQSARELLQLVPQLEQADEFHVLSVVEDSDLARFDLQCRIYAKHSGRHRLKDYLSEYNRLAASNGWRVIECTSHVHHMADVGARFLEAEKYKRGNEKRAGKPARMTEDFWALPKTFFIEALAAGDNFFLALDMAQEKVEAHVRNQNAPNYTRAEFRAAIAPAPKPPQNAPANEENCPPADSSDGPTTGEETPELQTEPIDELEPASERSDPLSEIVDRARAELGDDGLQETLERALTGEPEPPIDIEGGEVEESEPPTSRTCYDCEHCREIEAGQRLSLAAVDAGDQVTEVLGLFTACLAWYCTKRRQLLSVHAQRYERGASLAADCAAFELHEVEDGQGQEEGEETPLSVDAFMGEG